jgi:hypothetical protein
MKKYFFIYSPHIKYFFFTKKTESSNNNNKRRAITLKENIRRTKGETIGSC